MAARPTSDPKKRLSLLPGPRDNRAMNPARTSNPIFVALDTTDPDYARELAGRVGPHVGGLKLGLEFFSAHGPEGVRPFVESGLPVFLDLKYHDIPNTVAGAARPAPGLGAS